MKYKEFKEKVKAWAKTYDYRPIVEINIPRTLLKIGYNGAYKPMVRISNIDSYALDTNYLYFNDLANDAKQDLYKIVTEFAATPIEEREDEKRFIVPLPGLITTDGEQQYLSYKDGNFFASKKDETLIQTWKEKFVPKFYRQFAVEFDEGKEY